MGAYDMAYQVEKQELNEGFKALIEGIFQEKEKSDRLVKAFEEVVNDRATVSSFTIAELRDKAARELKDDLATKEFVRAESAKVRQEMAEMKSELKQEMADMKLELKQEMADMKLELKQDIAEAVKTNNKTVYICCGIVVAVIVLLDSPLAKILARISDILK